MLNRLPTPTECPTLSQILADLGNPAPKDLARSLGVSVSTIRRWLAVDHAPRPILLALFWLTTWGMSRVDAEAVNAARMHAARTLGLLREVARLQQELARVVSIADFGTANEPLMRGPSWRPGLSRQEKRVAILGQPR